MLKIFVYLNWWYCIKMFEPVPEIMVQLNSETFVVRL